MNIGIIGIRGYKSVYSGFETLVTNLVEKSSKKNFYYIFSRQSYKKREESGRIFEELTLFTLKNKYLETPSYAIISTIRSLFLPVDTVLYLSVANTPVIWLQKLKRRKVIVNVDGLDWKRERWNFFGKLYLKTCELIMVRFSDILIADSKYVYEYYTKQYPKKKIIHITYGAGVQKTISSKKTMKKFGLEANRYFLFVGRYTPENKIDDLLLAFIKLKTDYKCVVVGDSFFEKKYKTYLQNIAKNDKRIVFAGFLKRDSYEEILKNCYCYIETKSVGGVHLSLLEAMAFGKCVIARNLPEHKEALSKTGLYFGTDEPVENLTIQMGKILNKRSLVKKLGKLAEGRVEKVYSWDKVIKQYQELF